MQDRSPALIAVDLTPVLPGGDNGGAKVLALSLLRQLAARAPRARFLLLTQAASHAELATLDSDNISRRLVAGGVAGPWGGALQPLARHVLRLAPPRLNAVLGRLGYEVLAVLKRGGRTGLLRGLGVDLLFCPFTAPSFAEPGIPTVCLVHDLQFMAFPEFFAAEDLANRTWSFREACRRAAALVAVSDFTRAGAMAAARLAPERIRTIHPCLGGRFDGGLAGETGRVSPSAPGSGLGLTPGRYLLYPANFWPHKNHEMLLTAFGMARQSGLAPDLRLVCTGAPGERQLELAAAAAAMGLGKAVLFPGFLPAAAFGILLAQARGLVFPSLYEGFGLPVVEAMALGIPVACSDLTALPEIAGDAALFFDPRVPAEIAGALIRLNHDDAVRTRLIGAGRGRAADFSDREAMAAAYWRLFCSLTDGGS